jgi:multicomponent Na+:H+ antiporter subunit G
MIAATILDLLAATALVCGGLLTFLAGAGMVRMPDLFSRLSAASKASTLGSALLLVGAGIASQTMGNFWFAILCAGFLAFTVTLAAQQLGRAAKRRGEPLWGPTRDASQPSSKD